MIKASLKSAFRISTRCVVAASLSGCVATSQSTLDFDGFDDESHYAYTKIERACPQLYTVETKIVPSDFIAVTGAVNEQDTFSLGTIPLEPKQFEFNDYAQIAYKMYNLRSSEKAIIEINSYGGRIDVANYLSNSMKRSKGDVITVADGNSSSAASIILSSGKKGLRYIYSGEEETETIVHAIRKTERSNGKERDFFEKDFLPGSAARRSLKTSNQNLRLHYQNVSSTKIDATCTNEMVRGDIDYDFSPKDLVALGLADKALYPSTNEMLVRVNDYNR